MKSFNEIIGLIKRFIKSIFNISFKLSKPIDNFEYKKKKNSLLGTWYEKNFNLDKSIEIKSPIDGIINGIYPNNSISLINKDGLQVLILLIINNDKFENPFLELKKKDCEKVRKGEVLLITKELKDEELTVSLSVIIPWQYKLIKKVQNEKIFYRNPFTKAKIMNVYDYYE